MKFSRIFQGVVLKPIKRIDEENKKRSSLDLFFTSVMPRNKPLQIATKRFKHDIVCGSFDLNVNEISNQNSVKKQIFITNKVHWDSVRSALSETIWGETTEPEQTLCEITNKLMDIMMVSGAKKIITDIWLKEYEHYGYARWALIDKQSQQVIGFCGLK